jgi:membrane glycosyltransferase
MTDSTITLADVAPQGTTTSTLTQRRTLFAGLVAATMVAVLWLAAIAVPPYSVGAISFLVLFTITLPWSVIGFWNAFIGFLIMRLSSDPALTVNPMAASIRGDEITATTAILMCIRNESPEPVARNLRASSRSLIAAARSTPRSSPVTSATSATVGAPNTTSR